MTWTHTMLDNQAQQKTNCMVGDHIFVIYAFTVFTFGEVAYILPIPQPPNQCWAGISFGRYLLGMYEVSILDTPSGWVLDLVLPKISRTWGWDIKLFFAIPTLAGYRFPKNFWNPMGRVLCRYGFCKISQNSLFWLEISKQIQIWNLFHFIVITFPYKMHLCDQILFWQN